MKYYVTASEKQVWIVSDVRRQTDINWFQNNYAGKILTIRVEASEDTRTNRDWVFTSGKALKIFFFETSNITESILILSICDRN